MSKVNNMLEELATQVLVDNDMLYKIPVDVARIAKSYGIDVYEGEMDNQISGAIRYNKDTDKFQILINKSNSEVRQRFTIAHELGHYFLHKEMLKENDVHIDALFRVATEIDKETKEKEKQVDYFAGALLMNKLVVEKLYADYNIEELAKMFNVSASAMTVRLDFLGLL